MSTKNFCDSCDKEIEGEQGIYGEADFCVEIIATRGTSRDGGDYCPACTIRNAIRIYKAQYPKDDLSGFYELN